MRKITPALNVAVNLLIATIVLGDHAGFPVNCFKFWQFDSIWDNF